MTSGQPLSVELEQLSQTAAWLEETGRELEQRRKKLQKEADDVLGGSWQGTPATKVRQSWDEWTDGFSELMNAFNESRQLLAEARRAYEAQENATSSHVRSAGQWIGGLNLDV